MCSNIIPCPLCSQPAFSNSDSLRLALVSVATRHLSCPVCSELFLGLDKLTIHMFGHLHGLIQEKPLKIFNEFSTTTAVPNYIISAPSNTTATVPKNFLIFCGFKFNDRKIVDMHKNLVHSNIEINQNGDTILPCHLCTKKFRMKGSLMIHLRVAHFGFTNLRNHHENNNDLVTSPLMILTDADNKDTSITATSNMTSSLNCNICNKTFFKQQQLNVHLRTHDNKQWECDVCSKMFTTKYFLKKHKRLHTGEMPYNCNQCNKSFTFQQSYHKHMLYHSSDKPHVCGQCGRAFKELSTLHNHERIHSGERPFSCEICGKCFRQRVSCLVHRRIHTGAMPYHCTACGKKFRYKVSQRTHKCPSQPPGTVVRSENDPLSTQIIENPSPSNHPASTLSESINYDNLAMRTSPSIPTNLKTENSINETTEHSDIFLDDNKHVETTDDENTNNDTQNHLEVIKNTDFFSLVMSPMNVLSPSEKLQQLCLSNTPTQDIVGEKQHMDSDDHTNLFLCCNNNELIENKNVPSNDELHNDSLQTINEESLKQLLYCIHWPNHFDLNKSP
ncbi:zinc finger protein 626 [Chrysoperla carnea]|uniref:zinc finger protein 626 n=1 Tax=Chrysoperla carnea TaxID=189513 RepID=UPI001D076F06|nr:zinc finger protein 626 [Chrysoperla carnea]